RIPSSQEAQVSAADLFSRLATLAGVRIFVDPSAELERFPPLPHDLEVTSANVESVIERYVDMLPEGATWAKLHLPPPPEGREWKAKDVVAFARAQSRLYGVVGRPTPPDTAEILSQRIPAEKAAGILSALKLK